MRPTDNSENYFIFYFYFIKKVKEARLFRKNKYPGIQLHVLISTYKKVNGSILENNGLINTEPIIISMSIDRFEIYLQFKKIREV